MELNAFLSVLLYVVAIILLIVLTVLAIRLIQVLNKVDRIVDNVETKVNSLNGAFDLVGKASDTLSLIGDSVVSTVGSFVARIFNGRNKGKEDYYE